MPINITMPALSPTMEEGNLAKWLIKEGDKVASGDVIAEIETDKATMEVEAVDEGVLAKIVVPDGSEGVKVNSVIAVIAEEGEDVSAVANQKVDAGLAKPAGTQTPATEPAATKEAEVHSGQAEPVLEKPSSPVSTELQNAGLDNADRIFASPLARRIAGDANLDLASIKGSGPNGRIVKSDVVEALESGGGRRTEDLSQPAGSKVQSIEPMADDEILKLFKVDSYELVKHDNMRKIIAKRLVESKLSIPHFYVSVDCRIDALLKLRKEINSAAPVIDEKPAFKVSVNDMIIKALALALRDVPDANVSWSSDFMIHHKHSDVGVAVSIPGGLITPVVRQAEAKTLSVIAAEMKDYVARARDRKLKPEEYTGGSTAVSNMGMMGVSNFSAVINPPHATILAVGAGEKRPVVIEDTVQIATMMSVTLSTDHRAVDGAPAAELLGVFKRYIEKPMGMLV